MIRFQCPTCLKRLKAPDGGAGRKISCPKCGQRLLIPPPVRPQKQPQDRTALGQPMPDPDAPPAPSPLPPPGPPPGDAPQGQALVDHSGSSWRGKAARQLFRLLAGGLFLTLFLAVVLWFSPSSDTQR